MMIIMTNALLIATCIFLIASLLRRNDTDTRLIAEHMLSNQELRDIHNTQLSTLYCLKEINSKLEQLRTLTIP